MKIKEDQLFCLLKFGQREYMERLLFSGEIYLNPIRNYRESKLPEIADTNEGLCYLENTQLKSISFNHPSIGEGKLNITEGSISRLLQFDDAPYLNFSMCSVSSRSFLETNDYRINKRLLAFGDTCVMIKDPLQFLKAVTLKLKELNHKYEIGFVNYHDYSSKEKFELTPFDKSHEFEHQEEFRIVILAKQYQPLVVNIGSIEEYCLLVDAKTMTETEWTAQRSTRPENM